MLVNGTVQVQILSALRLQKFKDLAHIPALHLAAKCVRLQVSEDTKLHTYHSLMFIKITNRFGDRR